MDTPIQPVAYVRGGRTSRRDDGWDQATAEIELDARFDEQALAGLGAFSHVEIVFRFHTLTDEQVNTGARHPRGNKDWPLVGIFAQRGSKRPNRIGVSICRLLDVDGRRLRVRGLDAIDGTPVLDIKPVIREFLPRGDVQQPVWATALMQGYWDGEDIANDD